MKDESYVHGRENNPDSQQHLEANEQHFNKQCLKILALLRKGEVLTQRRGMIEFDIGDTRRRISELREGGIVIKDEWILDKEGKSTQCKKWFIPEFASPIKEVVYKKNEKASSDYSKELIKSTKKKVIIPEQQSLF